jgi:hypothetical protein
VKSDLLRKPSLPRFPGDFIYVKKMPRRSNYIVYVVNSPRFQSDLAEHQEILKDLCDAAAFTKFVEMSSQGPLVLKNARAMMVAL